MLNTSHTMSTRHQKASRNHCGGSKRHIKNRKKKEGKKNVHTLKIWKRELLVDCL